MRTTPRAVPALLALLLSVPALTACGDGDAAAAKQPASVADQAPEPAERCAAAGPVTKRVLTTADGVELAAAEFGDGPRGVVLLHQRGADLCGWSPYAEQWAADGLHVLAFDRRCNGSSECPGSEDYVADVTAAVDHLRSAGARKVVLVGASMGATISLVAGARLAGKVNGVVSLSAHSAQYAAAPEGEGPRTPEDAASTFAVPLLLVYAEQDSWIMTPEAAASFAEKAPTDDSEVVALEGATHGWDLLGDADVAARVDAWLAAHTG